ncbi:MAG: hypothetical protein ABIP74_03285 [Candidatus Saccharimonas sp.]
MTTTLLPPRTREASSSPRGIDTPHVDPRAEFQSGAHEAHSTIQNTIRENPNSDASISDMLRAKAENPESTYAERAKYALTSDAEHVFEIQRRMTELKRRYNSGESSGTDKTAFLLCRRQLVESNMLIKSYLDANRDQTIFNVHGLMTGTAQIMHRIEGLDAFNEAEIRDVRSIISGMRAELAAEQLWGLFESVEIEYALADDEGDKQHLEASGVDYIVTVTINGEPFELMLDIKAHERDTVNQDGKRIIGRIWNQCNDSDYKNHTSTVKNLNLCASAMQKALAEQILLRYRGRAQTLCGRLGIPLDNLWELIE